MPLTKPLAEHTLRELLEALSDESLRNAGQFIDAVYRTFGLPLTFTTAPGADVTDRIARLVGVVRDEWSDHIRAGRAFSQGDTITAAAGQFPQVELRNPAGSGVTLRVNEILVRTSTAAASVVLADAAVIAGGAASGRNLRLGGALSAVALIATQSLAAVEGSQFSFQRGALDAVFRWGDWPCDIPPGQRLIVRTNVSASVLFAAFRWAEVPA